MITKTLAERLDNIRGNLMDGSASIPDIGQALADCIAQAEREEAGELSDEDIERTAHDLSNGRHNDHYDGIVKGLRHARDHGYLRTSQAIGKPVALDNDQIEQVSSWWQRRGGHDRLARAHFEAGMREVLARRSPISTEARDRAIEALEVVEAGNAMRKYVQDHGWSKRERMDPQSEIFRLVSAWDAALASQPKEVAPTVEPVTIRRQRTASLTVDLIVEVRDSILRLMGYGVDMPTVEEIIIDLAKPTRP